MARILFNGQSIIEETMLVVDVTATRGRTQVLFVPLVYRERRRWKADALAFTLAQLVNNLWGRVGFEDYMKTAGVVASNYLGMHTGLTGTSFKCRFPA